jgi:hypothetical protein
MQAIMRNKVLNNSLRANNMQAGAMRP